MKRFRILVTATALLSCLSLQCAPQRAPEPVPADEEAAPRGALVGSPDPALFALLARNRVLGSQVGAGPGSRK